MSGVLVLDRLRVQGANAVAGTTWGFPAVSAFTGFTHALDRRLRGDDAEMSALFGGCAIVCHSHQPLTVAHYGTHQFSLARAPLTRQGKTAPFNEEGRMHMTVSLLIEIRDGLGDFIDTQPDDTDESTSPSAWLEREVERTVMSMRLAGGTILGIDRARYKPRAGVEGEEKEDRKLLFRCLPGFALVDRSELLALHLESLRSHAPDTDILEAWMDFAGLRFRFDDAGESGTGWDRVPLPEIGWFVPLMTGYQSISPLADPGAVPGTRDPSVPFQLVESVYGVGQWISPHRLKRIESLMWRFDHRPESGTYRLANHFDGSIPGKEETS